LMLLIAANGRKSAISAINAHSLKVRFARRQRS
jgi:hypothetical protein